MAKLRELMLLRHGKSSHKSPLTDIERPLEDRGKKAAVKIQSWLHQQSLFPDLILTSPAKRALQTLNRICPDKTTNVIEVPELYLADLKSLLQVLANCPNANRILIIGHNPGLEKLITYLSQSRIESSLSPQTKLFPTSALAHFIMPENWQALNAGEGKLMNLIRPRDLTKRIS